MSKSQEEKAKVEEKPLTESSSTSLPSINLSQNLSQAFRNVMGNVSSREEEGEQGGERFEKTGETGKEIRHEEGRVEEGGKIETKQRLGGAASLIKEPTLDLFNQLIMSDSHTFLDKTGLKVSRICLGSMNFGKIDENMGKRPGQLSEDEAHRLLDRFVELGGNFIDCADFFPWFGSTAGDTEAILGNWLQTKKRESLILIDKIRMPVDVDNINSVGLSRNHIIESVNRSLKRLRTSYIDILMINGWDETVSMFETVRHLNDLITSGKVMYIGVCDFKAWQLQKFVDIGRVLNLHKCVCYMGEYNLMTRGCEWEIFDICRNEKIAFISYSPLKYGFLTSNYSSTSQQAVEGSRIEAASGDKPNLAAMAEPFNEMIRNPVYGRVMDSCEKISQRTGLSISQVAILWCLQKGLVTSVVIGMSNLQELEENMKILSGELSLNNNAMRMLNDSSNISMPYPYSISISSLAGIRKLSHKTTFEQLFQMSSTFEERERRRQTYSTTTTQPAQPQMVRTTILTQPVVTPQLGEHRKELLEQREQLQEQRELMQEQREEMQRTREILQEQREQMAEQTQELKEQRERLEQQRVEIQQQPPVSGVTLVGGVPPEQLQQIGQQLEGQQGQQQQTQQVSQHEQTIEHRGQVETSPESTKKE